MEFFNVVSLEECIKILKKNFNFEKKKEKLRLENSLGRILAQDVYSEIDIPGYDRSTVDGYAINVSDSSGASETMPILMELKGAVGMGEISQIELKRGETAYVPTGGMVPKGANGIIMIEDSEKLGDNEILISRGISKNTNLILQGSEVRKNEKILSKGTKIGVYEISVLASLGKSEIEVYEQIKFHIISTGDEIIDISSPLKYGQIYDINSYAFKAMIEKKLGIVIKKVIVKDNPELLEKSIKEGIEKSDIVVISGGSSVGTMDYTKKSIEKNKGQILIHGMSIKPGKPTIIAKSNEKMILGLPGHPQSGIIVFRIILDTIFNIKRKYTLGKLTENVFGDPGKTIFINVKIENFENEIKIIPIYGKSSMVRPLMESDGYIIIPSHREGLYMNENVKVWLND